MHNTHPDADELLRSGESAEEIIVSPEQRTVRCLAGDIGGTKTRLAISEVRAGRVSLVREMSYPSRDFATFEDLLAAFLTQDGGIVDAAFGIAGPVQGNCVRTTNLPWLIDAEKLQGRFGIRCLLLNDLETTACGIAALSESELLTLQLGSEGACGNAAVIAAGTGLGEAGMFWDGRGFRPFATEGGHATFAPTDELEMTFFLYLQRQFGHVSWERVVSGMGLVSLYQFMCLYHKAESPSWLVDELREGDAAAAISTAALAGTDALCVETLRRFVRLYGAEAGNLALKAMSRGGLYLGGGIAPKILPLLSDGTFIEAFLNKGRMRSLLEAMPVRVIMNDRAALLGAALCASASC